METLRLLVQNLIIIAVFIVLMDLLLPDGSIRKYAQTVMGLMVTVAIIQAFSGLSGGKFFTEIEEYAWRGSSPYEFNSNIMEQGFKINDDNRRQAIEHYRMGIEKQIAALLGSQGDFQITETTVDVQDDPQKTNFGELQQILLVFGKKQELDVVEPVTVQLGDRVDNDEENSQHVKITDWAKETIANFYNIPANKVKINFN